LAARNGKAHTTQKDVKQIMLTSQLIKRAQKAKSELQQYRTMAEKIADIEGTSETLLRIQHQLWLLENQVKQLLSRLQSIEARRRHYPRGERNLTPPIYYTTRS